MKCYAHPNLKPITHPSSEMSGVKRAMSGASIAISVIIDQPISNIFAAMEILTHSGKITIKYAKRNDATQAIQPNHAQNDHAARNRRNYGQVWDPCESCDEP
jgi:hypothetical protein